MRISCVYTLSTGIKSCRDPTRASFSSTWTVLPSICLFLEWRRPLTVALCLTCFMCVAEIKCTTVSMSWLSQLISNPWLDCGDVIHETTACLRLNVSQPRSSIEINFEPTNFLRNVLFCGGSRIWYILTRTFLSTFDLSFIFWGNTLSLNSFNLAERTCSSLRGSAGWSMLNRK